MKYLLTSICFVAFYSLIAQSSYSEDSLKLVQTLEWLENKLTYNYYNIDDEEWWINRFTYNEDSETVTIKNIASPQLQAITDKTYLQLNFRLDDLNPYTISIQKNEKNAGRLVAGKTIRIGAYGRDKSIKKTRNRQLSSNISFIYISIPKHYEDSISSSYAKDISTKLQEAIMLSTRVYPEGTTDANHSLIKNILTESEFRSGERSWSITNLHADVIEVAVKNNGSELTEKRFLRFLKSDIEMTIIRPKERSQIIYLKQEDPNQLTFKGQNHQLKFVTLNEFTYIEDDHTWTFIRD